MFRVSLFKRACLLVAPPVFVSVWCSAPLKRGVKIACTARWHRLKEDKSGAKPLRLLGIAETTQCVALMWQRHQTQINKCFHYLLNTSWSRCDCCCSRWSRPPVSHIQAGSRWCRDTGAVRSRGQILHRVPSSAARCSDHPGELPQPDHPGNHPPPGETTTRRRR